MTYAGDEQTAFVAVKMQQSPQRGEVWRVCVFVDGKRLIRPGFQKQKPALKLAGMMVQQMLIHGWKVRWEVRDEKGKLVDINLADLGGKMRRGEKQGAKP
jgi:hypothetical protein